MEPHRLAVGRIVKPHGIRGEVSVEVYSETPDRFAEGASMTGQRGSEQLALAITSVRTHQGRLLVMFDGVDDRDAAEALRGVILTIPFEEAAPLGEWQFYPFQLVGCEVVDVDGVVLGEMRRVEESPANDLWVVVKGSRSVYVPAVRDIVKQVDLERRRIVLDPPVGLF